MQQETGVSIRKSFQDKKPGRSSGFGREFGSFQQGPALGQSHKSTAFLCSNEWHRRKGFYCSISSHQPLPAWGLSPGMAWPTGQSSERAGTACIQEPLNCCTVDYTSTHKQSISQLAVWRHQAFLPGVRVPSSPRGPLACITSASTRHFRSSLFWLGQSLGPTEKMGSLAAKCTSELLLPPPLPGLKGSLELPTGFSRNKTPPAWKCCNPQHSYTQRNSWSVI